MNKKILITGAKGFLGQNCVRFFKSQGYQTYGIGHGNFSIKECQNIGLDYWYKSDITIESINKINQVFDIIIHCGGSGSVGYSVENPYGDFKKTVEGTLEVIEYIRLYNPNAHLIYPSSPAVQGECEDKPIKEEYIGKPASPYGYHKKIAEDLCQSYSEKFNLKISIVRLFSVYGNGLKKQLLWDAVNKLKNSTDEVVFWGTGNETRDFIHIDDVLKIFNMLVIVKEKFLILNGGTGIKYSVKDIVEMIKELINPSISIKFNNQINIGNPIYYWADTKKLQMYDIKVFKRFENEIKNYVKWIEDLND